MFKILEGDLKEEELEGEYVPYVNELLLEPKLFSKDEIV